MGTEILRPQDCLMERLRVGPTTTILPRRKPYTAANSNPNPKFYRKTEQKKQRFPQSEKDFFLKKSTTNCSTVGGSRSSAVVKNDLITIGQVTILKRGESLDIKRKNENFGTKRTISGDLSISSASEILGTNPEMDTKQIRITDLKSSSFSSVSSEVYAGSAFYLSPSPSSLPLPTFSIKKEGLAIVDDSATKDLRRLLGLD